MELLAIPQTARVFLETGFGALSPLGQKGESRTFRAGSVVLKIFSPTEKESAQREAANIERAGLGEWVLDILKAPDLAGYEVLVLRAFAGEPFQPERYTAKVEAKLAELLRRVHSLDEPGWSKLAEISERIALFRQDLVATPEAVWLLDQLAERAGEFSGVPLHFCHQDLWAGNVLVSDQEEVFLVDWGRAGGEDPARDLAILKTGTLDLLGESESVGAAHRIVGTYREGAAIWHRMRFFVPLTYLHDLYWFKNHQPIHLEAALAQKLPRALSFYRSWAPL